MTLKAVNKICPLYLSKRFTLIRNPQGVTTRGNAQNKLRVNKVCNKYDSKTFVNNATKLWNVLPTEFRTSKSLVTFTSKLKSHFFDA